MRKILVAFGLALLLGACSSPTVADDDETCVPEVEENCRGNPTSGS